eukprot:scaffold7355_cov101-Phaeocystis_antarctica.AAC.1
MALEAQFAPLRALATPPAQTAASPVSERGRVSRTHSTENLMTTVRWFTYALSFNLETSMDSGLCAISPKHRYRTSYTTRACAPPMREREREIAREIAHSVTTQLKAGAFQMFHRVYRVMERPRASRIVPNRPRGCSLCLGAHGRFGLLMGANSATRREA